MMISRITLLLFLFLSSLHTLGEVIVDLTQQDMFVRPGFEHSWLRELPDAEEMDSDAWIKIPAASNGNRSVVVKFIDHQGRNAWISKPSQEERVETFTFVTGF